MAILQRPNSVWDTEINWHDILVPDEANQRQGHKENVFVRYQ